MDTLSEIQTRLNKLEKKNSFFRKLSIFLCLFILFGGLIGWQSASQFFQTIETEKLVIKDKSGKERAILFVDDSNNVKLRFLNSSKEQTLCLGADSLNGYFKLLNNQNEVVNIYNLEKEGYIQIKHPNDLLAITLSNNKLITAMGIYDTKGKLKYGCLSSDTVNTQVILNRKEGNKGVFLSAIGTMEFYGKKDEKPTMQLHSWDGFNQFVFNDGDKQLIGLTAIELGGVSQISLSDYDNNRIFEVGRVIADSNMNTTNDISFYSLEGKKIIQFIEGGDNTGCLLFKENDKLKIQLGLSKQALPQLLMFDKSDNIRLVLGLNEYSKPSLMLADGLGKFRAVFGSSSTNNSRGEIINHPESSIWLFDENGNGIFSAPNE